jgi:hypothetical protein
MRSDYSAVLILPASLRDSGNQLATALGHDEAEPPDTYNVPLFPIGAGVEPTHYGTHTWATAAFKGLIEAAQSGAFPEGLESAAPLVAELITSFTLRSEADASAHFDAIAAAHGLERRGVSE